MLRKYEIVENTPPNISWDEYEQYLISHYSNLLENKSDDERVFQAFFEKHPCMLPGAFGMLGESGHLPFGSTLISMPKLIGLQTKIPDFMWIACDSGTIYPVLIEIEAPIKEWFLPSGKPTEKFNQALDQLTDWKVWFSNPKHQLLYYDYYKIPSSFYWKKSFVPLYILIYGRITEYDEKIELNEKRKQLERDNEFFMTYDRLQPSYKAKDILCSKLIDGQYVAIAVPPTFRLGPVFAGDYSLINNKENAVLENELISLERKEFLISRIPYWDKYGKKQHKGLMHSKDVE